MTVIAMLVIAAWLSATGCTSARAQANQEKGQLSDANIAAILIAAGQSDVAYASLAPTRAESPAVKDFARHVLSDHVALDAQVTELLTRMDLVPDEDSTSLRLRDDSSVRGEVLSRLQGRTFDSTFMANEVSHHAKLLASIDDILLPNARNPELRELLESVRPAVARHLEQARTITGGVVAAK